MSQRFRISIFSAAMSLLTLIGLGTWIFHTLEKWSWAESFYFTVATLTTVGYGDIHPSSDNTRVIAALFILIGVGIVIAALTRIGSEYLAAQEQRLSDNITRRVHRREQKDAEK